MTFQELIDAALEQAMAGLPLDSPVVDSDIIAETLVPNVFQDIALRYAADPDKRSLLLKTHTLSLTDGVATLPDEALSQAKGGAVISDPDDVSVAQNAALVWNWNDFVAPRNGLLSQIPQWTIRNDIFYYLEADATYDPSDGFNGELELMIATIPETPTLATGTLDIPVEAESDMVAALAQAIRGLVMKAA